ncbi:MAG: D-alanine--D-alanine ligase [Gammaproteobacteria bacterium]|nr:D-alanine--D-alanine ligase [Gammaproteobacteria bacterium]
MSAQIPAAERDIVAAAGGVAVLMGGASAERAVSLKSGAAVLAALQRAGVDAWGIDWQGDLMAALGARRPDRVFIALHGRGGEDGQVQGALDVAGIPYTGSGVLGCALSMDKIRSKWIWTSLALPTPDFVVIDADETIEPVALVARLGLPLVIKPSREGSSFGVSKVERVEDVATAIAHARSFDVQILAERWITGGEYTLSIVDGVTLPMIKLETPHAFYDYEAKYLVDTTRYLCPCGLPPEIESAAAAIGRRAFTALGASGWGRVDFMFDRTLEPWLIELNSVPGMTDHSLVPMAAAQHGWSFDRLVLRILRSSFGGRS